VRLVKVLLVCVLTFCFFNISWAGDDWEIWPGNTAKLKINDKTSFRFIEQFRTNDNMSTFYQYVMYAGVYTKLHKYFDAAAWYKFVESKVDQHWEDSHRVDVDGIIKYTVEPLELKLSNRSRLEYNITSDSWVYRDRIKVSGGLEIFNKKFTPYVFNELFFSLGSKGQYNENRANLGMSTDFLFDTKLTFYYMARTKKSSGKWVNANVLGVNVGMSF